MSRNESLWTESIPKLPGWITGFITFVSHIVGFTKLWRGDTGLVTVVLLAVGLGGGMARGAYIALSRTPPQIEGGRGALRYSKAARRCA
ncbi:MAG: hypothetical protein HWN51_07485 [Desulfobacterales bacterium]|nr:hypothetical protein [Desulfobacterales bacterium]